MSKSTFGIGTFWHPSSVAWRDIHRCWPVLGMGPCWRSVSWYLEGCFLTSCHLTEDLEEEEVRVRNGPAGGKRTRWMGYFCLSRHSPETCLLSRQTHEGRQRVRKRARRDQRMTGEREEESRPKQRLVLKFPCAAFLTGWRRGRDMDSTPQPALISTSGHITGNKWAPVIWGCIFYIHGIFSDLTVG